MTDQNYFRFLRDDYPVKEFQKDMLHSINIFKENMEKLYGMNLSRSKRDWMIDFLKWLEWGTDMDEEYWGLTETQKYDTFESEPE